jgi:uncharacterized protein with beta-barrel porin domain
LATKQFFATGEAAENLAKNKELTEAFQQKSTGAIFDSLTKEQRDAAIAAGTSLATQTDKEVETVIAAMSCDGKKTLDPTLRDRLKRY